MTYQTLVRAAFLAAAGALLASGVAFASTFVVTERAVDVHFDAPAVGATTDCGFPIEVHTVGNGMVISRYDGDRLVSQTIQFVWNGYFLNPANGHRIDSKVAGPDGCPAPTQPGAPGSSIIRPGRAPAPRVRA
jgi:hypothetical protein